MQTAPSKRFRLGRPRRVEAAWPCPTWPRLQQGVQDRPVGVFDTDFIDTGLGSTAADLLETVDTPPGHGHTYTLQFRRRLGHSAPPTWMDHPAGRHVAGRRRSTELTTAAGPAAGSADAQPRPPPGARVAE